MPELTLSGLNGHNPLAFLAALGTFRILSDAFAIPVRMSWRSGAVGSAPVLAWDDEDEHSGDQWLTAGIIACELGCPARHPTEQSLLTLSELDKTYRSERKALFELEKSLKEQGKSADIKGEKLSQWVAAGTSSKRGSVTHLRASWLTALEKIALSPELGLGKTLAVTAAELRALATRVAADCSQSTRLVADLVAAFGAEQRTDDDYIQATDFCFVNGSGQQFFLETVQKLLYAVTADKIRRALFESWTYDDLRFSLRWDPLDDRRYALMWGDPKATGNETRTMWGANLLAYYGLSFFPCFANSRTVNTTGFSPTSQTFTWPIWTGAISVDVVRSLLAREELGHRPIDRQFFNHLGVCGIHEAARIRVGTPPLVKVNFSQSKQPS